MILLTINPNTAGTAIAWILLTVGLYSIIALIRGYNKPARQTAVKADHVNDLYERLH